MFFPLDTPLPEPAEPYIKINIKRLPPEPTIAELRGIIADGNIHSDTRKAAQDKLRAMLGVPVQEPGDPKPEECAEACDQTAEVGKCADCEYPFLSKRIEYQRKSIFDLTEKNERLAKRVQELEQDIAHRNNVAKTVSDSHERMARRLEETKKQRDELLKRVEELEAEKKNRGKTLSELLEESLRSELLEESLREKPGTSLLWKPPALGYPYVRPTFYYMVTPNS